MSFQDRFHQQDDLYIVMDTNLNQENKTNKYIITVFQGVNYKLPSSSPSSKTFEISSSVSEINSCLLASSSYTWTTIIFFFSGTGKLTYVHKNKFSFLHFISWGCFKRTWSSQVGCWPPLRSVFVFAIVSPNRNTTKGSCLPTTYNKWLVFILSRWGEEVFGDFYLAFREVFLRTGLEVSRKFRNY